jgi:hypothetical protein
MQAASHGAAIDINAKMIKSSQAGRCVFDV